MKTNFRKSENDSTQEHNDAETNLDQKKDLSAEEFEKFIVDSGAKGSFMIYRSPKKDDELGIDNL